MTISEESRHRLYLRLEEVLGSEEASVLMEHLPPVGWAEVATKRDIDALAVVTKRDIDALAMVTKREIDALAVVTKRDLDALESRMDLKLESVASRIEGRLDRELRGVDRELRLMTWRLALAMLTLASLAVAAPHF